MSDPNYQMNYYGPPQQQGPPPQQQPQWASGPPPQQQPPQQWGQQPQQQQWGAQPQPVQSQPQPQPQGQWGPPQGMPQGMPQGPPRGVPMAGPRAMYGPGRAPPPDAVFGPPPARGPPRGPPHLQGMQGPPLSGPPRGPPHLYGPPPHQGPPHLQQAQNQGPPHLQQTQAHPQNQQQYHGHPHTQPPPQTQPQPAYGHNQTQYGAPPPQAAGGYYGAGPPQAQTAPPYHQQPAPQSMPPQSMAMSSMPPSMSQPMSISIPMAQQQSYGPPTSPVVPSSPSQSPPPYGSYGPPAAHIPHPQPDYSTPAPAPAAGWKREREDDRSGYEADKRRPGEDANRYSGGKYGPVDGDDRTSRYGGGGDSKYGNGGSDSRYGSGGSDNKYGPGGSDNKYGNGGSDSKYGNGGSDNKYGSGGSENRFGGGGGGGGGNRFSGGGGRGGGGGRPGKKPHMGEIDSVLRLIRDRSQILDTLCRSIIDPPAEERDRDNFLSEDRSSKWLPRMEAWRVSKDAGILLDNSTHILRANFFRVNPQSLPDTLFHYNVSIFKYDKDGETIASDDLSKENDRGTNTSIVKLMLSSRDDWKEIDRKKVGFAYDGKASLYTTAMLVLKKDALNELHFQTDVVYPPGSNYTFQVIITKVAEIMPPKTNKSWRTMQDQSITQALDVSLLSFARWAEGETDPRWIITGTKAYKSDGASFKMSPPYIARLGYNASLRTCLSGLCLVADISVSCFLQGGNLVELFTAMGNFRSVDELVRSSDPKHGLSRQLMRSFEDLLRNARIKTIHLGHTKKIKGFGPPACHEDAAFKLEDGTSMTVAEYFSQQAAVNDRYAAHLSKGKLRYPTLPLVQIGSKKKPIYIPPELVLVIPGQSRQQSVPPEITSNLIKYAAQGPNERFNAVSRESEHNGLFSELAADANVAAFGLSNISTEPMKVQGFILPPPKLQYGQGKVIEPQLTGAWNLSGGTSFAHPGTSLGSAAGQPTSYAVVVILGPSMRDQPRDTDNLARDFVSQIEREARNLGLSLSLCSRSSVSAVIEANRNELLRHFKELRGMGARLIIALLAGQNECYAPVKLAGDALTIPTQCVRWQNLTRPPRNYHTSLLVKINAKLGGVNHTLASRANKQELRDLQGEESFQFPPKSISWLFEEPCMVMGVDVNHPEIGSGALANSPSVAAVVASMDGKLGQYCAHISTCASKEEPVDNLEVSVLALLKTFSARNQGNMPKRIIVYRDGVSDNQFEKVLEKELAAYKDALMQLGYGEDSVQIAIVMCQKRHHTRLVYQQGSAGSEEYLNPCVGLCVDGRSMLNVDPDTASKNDVGCINTPGLNEFYLNSHAAVLGTSKPCKYVLIYDEIGLTMAEIELLTFWTTHLYSRCTRSVSYATPAYYAHWAARRGKALLTAGATTRELVEISEGWLRPDVLPSLYFA